LVGQGLRGRPAPAHGEEKRKEALSLFFSFARF
jgi:hypothetical protein